MFSAGTPVLHTSRHIHLSESSTSHANCLHSMLRSCKDSSPTSGVPHLLIQQPNTGPRDLRCRSQTTCKLLGCRGSRDLSGAAVCGEESTGVVRQPLHHAAVLWWLHPFVTDRIVLPHACRCRHPRPSRTTPAGLLQLLSLFVLNTTCQACSDATSLLRCTLPPVQSPGGSHRVGQTSHHAQYRRSGARRQADRQGCSSTTCAALTHSRDQSGLC